MWAQATIFEESGKRPSTLVEKSISNVKVVTSLTPQYSPVKQENQNELSVLLAPAWKARKQTPHVRRPTLNPIGPISPKQRDPYSWKSGAFCRELTGDELSFRLKLSRQGFILILHGPQPCLDQSLASGSDVVLSFPYLLSMLLSLLVLSRSLTSLAHMQHTMDTHKGMRPQAMSTRSPKA